MADKPLPSPELLRQLLKYDPTTGIFYWKERPEQRAEWNTAFSGKVAGGSCGKSGYWRITINDTGHSAHRLAWVYWHGEWPLGQIDHINGIRSDNRIENLRVVTPQQNQQNKKRGINNKSGTVGVHWSKINSKWRAYIMVSKKMHYLGFFINLSDAITARKNAEIKYGFHEHHGR